MEKKIPLEFEVGFSDSKILSYKVQDSNIVVILECWNAEIIEIKFLNYVSVCAMNYFRIAEIYEVFESPLLERALSELFEETPKIHPLRIFRFANPDDMTSLEIISEGFEIKRTA